LRLIEATRTLWPMSLRVWSSDSIVTPGVRGRSNSAASTAAVIAVDVTSAHNVTSSPATKPHAVAAIVPTNNTGHTEYLTTVCTTAPGHR
jgi:hypothetical protein